LQLFEFYSKFENGRSGHEMTHNGRRLSYIAWSPSRWSTPDQAASPTGVSPPPQRHNPRQQQASNNRLKRPGPSPNDCITLREILWCGRWVWGNAVGGVDRPRQARIAAETIPNRFSVPSN